jgi:deazaflavin-dependent oxidoreductase (nitroreductase family)
VPRPDTALGRVVTKVAASESFLRTAPSWVPRVDRFLNRVTGGRFMMTGDRHFPALVLATTGAKTGQRRETPLGTVPHDGGFLVVGSNYGKPTHPAWTANLLANPDAEVTFKGERFPVRARLLSETERDEVWPVLLEHWPNYDRYVERSGRTLRVFRLERVP